MDGADGLKILSIDDGIFPVYLYLCDTRIASPPILPANVSLISPLLQCWAISAQSEETRRRQLNLCNFLAQRCVAKIKIIIIYWTV